MTYLPKKHVARLAKEADRLVAKNDDFNAISFFLMIQSIVDRNPQTDWDHDFLNEVDSKYRAASIRNDKRHRS